MTLCVFLVVVISFLNEFTGANPSDVARAACCLLSVVIDSDLRPLLHRLFSACLFVDCHSHPFSVSDFFHFVAFGLKVVLSVSSCEI